MKNLEISSDSYHNHFIFPMHTSLIVNEILCSIKQDNMHTHKDTYIGMYIQRLEDVLISFENSVGYAAKICLKFFFEC